MVHSIELLFDPDTEARLRDIWAALAAADIPSQAPPGRPHVTLAVADRIAEDPDELVRPLTKRLPLACAVGASSRRSSRSPAGPDRREREEYNFSWSRLLGERVVFSSY